ncbi:MAG: hypothetical protein G01um101425_806 [Candidatus Peregrinibacteria bacterium Gr01-1014_25]|nr:MAG: hypothetical protein G01um101425_806 [Candidatus Peregrinibacteria bacterium Gr01-1014_25]
MTKLYAINAAIHGTPLRMSTSVVAGNSKEEIRTQETWTEPIQPKSADSVHAVLSLYLQRIGQVFVKQRLETDRVPLPVVFGWPAEFTSGALVANIRERFGDILPPPPRVSKKEKRERKAAPMSPMTMIEREKVSKRHMETVGQLVKCYTSRVLGATDGAIDFSPRAFTDTYADIPSQRDRMADRARVHDFTWEIVFNALLEKAKAGDTEAKRALDERVREQAREMALTLIQARQLADGQGRFIMTGLPHPPFTENLRLNCFTELNLRDVFARELIRIIGYRHHIALKAPMDPPSRPFADVGATFIADNFNALTGSRDLTAAIVRHDLPREPEA